MSGRDRKAQLGARIPKEVRDAALQAAQREGVSLNVWIENLIREKVTAPALVIDGQTTIDVLSLEPTLDTLEVFAPSPGSSPSPRGKAATMVILDEFTAKPFDRNCKNGTLHWRNSPDNPCRFCGGEA